MNNYIDGVDDLGFKSYLCPQKKVMTEPPFPSL